MKMIRLDTVPVKSLRETFNKSYTFIVIELKNGARIELTQSRMASKIVLSEIRAKINGVVASIGLDNGDELFKWYEDTLQQQHKVDHSDPVKDAGLELHKNMKEWLV